MKKLQLEICCGTSCFMLGADKLLNIENDMPTELRGKVEIRALPCLELCNDSKLGGAPYVKLNSEIIEKATCEKIFDRMRELLDASPL